MEIFYYLQILLSILRLEIYNKFKYFVNTRTDMLCNFIDTENCGIPNIYVMRHALSSTSINKLRIPYKKAPNETIIAIIKKFLNILFILFTTRTDSFQLRKSKQNKKYTAAQILMMPYLVKTYLL